MSRTIIIDANVIDQINRGNKAAADKLLELQRGGNKIWTAHQSHNELIVQPLIPRTAAANASILEELRIPLAPPGTMRERAETYAKNPLTAGLSEGKDLMLAAQAVVNKAELWSFDKAFRNNHAQWKKVMDLDVAPESYTLPVVKGTPADYRVGRKLLGLQPVHITLRGVIEYIGTAFPPRRILDPPSFSGTGSSSGGAGGGGTSGSGTSMKSAYVGTPSAPIVVSGPSPKADGARAGIELTFRGINLILDLITDEINTRRANEALNEREADIIKHSARHPEQGTLVVLYFKRILPAHDSVLVPKPVFDHLRLYHGRTLQMAKDAWRAAPDVSVAAGAGRTWEAELLWFEPVRPKPIELKELRLPFPPIGLGRFVPGKIRFRNAEFGGESGFDDCGETVLDDEPPTGNDIVEFLRELGTAMLPFYVLRPRKKLEWFIGGSWRDTNLKIISRFTSNSRGIDVIDMDPIMLGNVAAAMVFPASEATLKIFRMAPPIDDNLNLLRNVANPHLIRFIEPLNIHFE